MANEQYEKGKIKLGYSKKQIKKAGESIRKRQPNNDAVLIIQNYRAAHLYPLTIIKNLVWKHIQKTSIQAVIARRLKRLPTIIDKLSRQTLDGFNANSICITRMQDIGGCRVIVDNRSDLLRINESLNLSRTVHSTIRMMDYTIIAKGTGYRGIHRVYKCYDKKDSHDWKGFYIELQLRTKLQHLWATTVEVVDLCEGRTLKTNPFNADPDWIEFFKVMSDFFANDDGFISLSNIEKEKRKRLLLSLNRKLCATDKLNSFNQIFSNNDLVNAHADHRYAIIAIDLNSKETYYKFYRGKDKSAAIELYSDIEKNEKYNGLFVEMDDVRQLKYAYPNYLIDTSTFLDKFDVYVTSNYWVNPSRNADEI